MLGGDGVTGPLIHRVQVVVRGVGGSGRPVGDVKSLEAQLNRLTKMAKAIAERAKVGEANLKEAKRQEAAALRAYGAYASSAVNSRDSKSPANNEKRLDRIEQALEEIQKEMRRKR